MLLAIDVGNTNSKFVVFDHDRIVAAWRLRTESKRTADEYAAWVTQLMHLQGFDPRSIKGAILASVGAGVNHHLRAPGQTYFHAQGPEGGGREVQGGAARPSQALTEGGNHLVIGRPITAAADPRASARAISESLALI